MGLSDWVVRVCLDVLVMLPASRLTQNSLDTALDAATAAPRRTGKLPAAVNTDDLVQLS